MKKMFLISMLLIEVIRCKNEKGIPIENNQGNKNEIHSSDILKMTEGFDFPVGKPDAKGYYNAQKFTENNHLGEDWNGVHGGNTDLRDSIYAIANGYVSFAKNIQGGWGNVIRIIHHTNKNRQIESLYAHCDSIIVKKCTYVNKGDYIGTIGTNNGQYLAHLHLELRSEINLPVGTGYSSNTDGFLNPTSYIKDHRE